jgi:DNA-binding response OmpR family regulator
MKKKILLIDGNDDMLVTMKMLLTINGYNAEMITKSKEAIDVIEEFKPDIILMEYDHHSSEDRSFCDFIRKDKKPNFTPVILLTSLDGHLDYKKYGYKNFRAVDHLEKPFEMRKLQKMLTRHLKDT